MSLHRVVGFLLLKSCLMAFLLRQASLWAERAKTSALPLPFFWVYCWAPMTMVSEPCMRLMRSINISRAASFSYQSRASLMFSWSIMTQICKLLKDSYRHCDTTNPQRIPYLIYTALHVASNSRWILIQVICHFTSISIFSAKILQISQSTKNKSL